MLEIVVFEVLARQTTLYESSGWRLEDPISPMCHEVAVLSTLEVSSLHCVYPGLLLLCRDLKKKIRLENCIGKEEPVIS